MRTTININIHDHDALNAAFAEKVAGWTDVRHESGEDVDIDAREIYPWAGLAGNPPDGQRRRLIPDYTRSMNAVLPWLEKGVFWSNTFNSGYHIAPSERNWVTVGIGSGREFEGYAPTLPHAAVVALLRAKGVEVTEDKP